MRLSHELLVGIKCMWNRGWRLNQRNTWDVFMGRVVVHDQVQRPGRRGLLIEQRDEPQPFLMAMPR